MSVVLHDVGDGGQPVVAELGLPQRHQRVHRERVDVQVQDARSLQQLGQEDPVPRGLRQQRVGRVPRCASRGSRGTRYAARPAPDARPPRTRARGDSARGRPCRRRWPGPSAASPRCVRRSARPRRRTRRGARSPGRSAITPKISAFSRRDSRLVKRSTGRSRLHDIADRPVRPGGTSTTRRPDELKPRRPEADDPLEAPHLAGVLDRSRSPWRSSASSRRIGVPDEHPVRRQRRRPRAAGRERTRAGRSRGR